MTPVETVETTEVEAAWEGTKNEIHSYIDAAVKEKTGKRIGLTTAKEIFDGVVEQIFQQAVKNEGFRFPGGFGSLHLKKLGKSSAPKRLPSGVMVEIPEGRVKLRYTEGSAVKKLTGSDK